MPIVDAVRRMASSILPHAGGAPPDLLKPRLAYAHRCAKCAAWGGHGSSVRTWQFLDAILLAVLV
ncbi:MAG TPA: hypothetical protein VK390_13660, partial [Propionibacteriaceae bacterium]|nr:hypothetical protein [Propionibacteriaceae bacterium]